MDAPLYLETHDGWHLKKLSSIDSQAFLLKKGKESISFDYGVISTNQKIFCSTEEFLNISSFEALKCLTQDNSHALRKIRLSVRDPYDDKFSLLVTINLDEKNKNETMFLEILKTLKFLDGIPSIKLIKIDKTLKSAVIVDESGKTRIVKKGMLVARNHGVILEIKREYIIIQDFLLTESGEFVNRQKKILLSL